MVSLQSGCAAQRYGSAAGRCNRLLYTNEWMYSNRKLACPQASAVLPVPMRELLCPSCSASATIQHPVSDMPAGIRIIERFGVDGALRTFVVCTSTALPLRLDIALHRHPHPVVAQVARHRLAGRLVVQPRRPQPGIQRLRV